MKAIFIKARADVRIELNVKELQALPKTIALFTTAQYYGCLENVRKQLEKAGKKALLLKPAHCRPGQLLGCSIHEFKEKFDAFLYIGDGTFHPKALMFYNKPVYTYSPYSRKLAKLDKAETEKIKKRVKGALLKFLSSERIGILISVKPGQKTIQAGIKELEGFEKKYPGKRFYYFISDEIRSLENFPFIDVFINTACPRLALDDQAVLKKPVLNFRDALFQ